MKKKWILFLLLFFGIFFCFEKGMAFQIEKTESKSDGHFVVHPVKIDFEVNASQSKEFDLIVVNRTGQKSRFFVKEEFYKNANLLPIEKD